MQHSSDVEQSKHHYYYYPLAASDSGAAKTDVRDERKREGSYSGTEEDGEVGSYENKVSENERVAFQSKPRLNKYTLASAILASTNSILLGYGKLTKISSI